MSPWLLVVAEAEYRNLPTLITPPELTTELTGREVNYITAIGVMFHITDDSSWENAIRNLAGVLKPDSVMFTGGEFGAATHNVHCNKVDDFEIWRDFRNAEGKAGEMQVNKRARSLAQWTDTAQRCGLQVVEVSRTPKNAEIAMPENNLLVLVKG
ncbi:MAG: hypothetical protein ACI9JM_000811 [Halioglobus sp.]|jgi:hypothetical protein